MLWSLTLMPPTLRGLYQLPTTSGIFYTMQTLFHKALLAILAQPPLVEHLQPTLPSVDVFIRRGGLCTHHVATATVSFQVHAAGREFLGSSVVVICDFTHGRTWKRGFPPSASPTSTALTPQESLRQINFFHLHLCANWPPQSWNLLRTVTTLSSHACRPPY